MTKFSTDDYGRLACDPIGAYVTYQYKGRILLGTVTGIRMIEDQGERLRVVTVRHFNGEPWPVEPFFMSVDVLER